jgi:rubrerythrin
MALNLSPPTPLSHAQHYNLFKAMKELYDIEVGPTSVSSVEEVYRKAMQVEKDSYELYEKKAQECKSPEQKAIFMKIAAEERLHEKLLYNVMRFLSRPDEWISCAEFSHIGEEEFGAGATK